MTTKNKAIISANPGGIANRIKCLVSMWRLSDKFEKPFYIHWVRNHTCGANFSDLFENDFKEISTEMLQKVSKENYTLSETYRFVPLAGEVPDGFAKAFPTTRGNNIDFEFERTPPEVRENILAYLRQIKPIESIRRIADHYTEKFNVPNLVGVHVRRGDGGFVKGAGSLGDISSDNKFFEKMKEVVSEDPDAQFLLCTDCPETEEKFKKTFGGRIFIYPKKDRDRTTVLNTQQGLIDMLLLSRTKHIIGAYRSTFNELAWWLGGCKAKVDIIVDDEQKKFHEANQKKMDKSVVLKSKRGAYNLLKKMRLFRK